MNKEEKFLEWAGYMNGQTIYGAPMYNSDEVIDFEKYYNPTLTNKENEKEFKKWVDNDYSL